MKMKHTGITLIVLGALLFVVRAFDISFMSSTPLNAISLALFLGLPFIGATLLFGERYLRRPPGIDNDHIYHKSISARGTLALLAGFGLTALYIIVYLGSDFVVSTDQATIRINGRGQIESVDADEDMRGYLDYYCTECDGLSGTKHDRLFAFADELHNGIQSVMRGEQDEIKARFGRSYINAFEVKVAELIDSGARPEVPDEGAPTDELNAPGLNDPAREPGFIIQPGLRPVTVNITRTDTLHHFFARHVYSLFDPLARIIRNRAADNWFFYGTMYTYAMLLFG
ncbi:MAG: hypothetical protein KDK34_17355, partial [Leptospiraceae bacterium]|nr:hypothetical protein [Leptospiraceae bacterium]